MSKERPSCMYSDLIHQFMSSTNNNINGFSRLFQPQGLRFATYWSALDFSLPVPPINAKVYADAINLYARMQDTLIPSVAPRFRT